MVTPLSSAPLSRNKQPSSQIAPLRLEVVGGEYDGRIIELVSRKISIGSGRQSTLRLVGCELNPVELFIVRGERHSVVRNWSAGNQINGRAFDDAILQPGDRLSVGSVEFVVSAAEPVATAPEDTDSTLEARAESNSTSDNSPTQAAETLNELNQVRAQVAELREQLQSHSDEARNDLEQWQRERAQWIDELAESRQQTISANRDLDELTAQRDELQKNLAALEAQLKEKADADTHNNQIGADEYARLVEQIEADAAALEQLTSEVEQSNQRLAETQQKYDQIRSAAEAATVAIAEAEGRIRELEAELAAVRSAHPTIVSDDDSSAEQDEELLARIEEIETREKALAAKAEQLEEAAFKVELMKEAFEEERATLLKRAEQSGDESEASSDDNERALVELLQLREQLDRQSAELQQRENELAQREREFEAGAVESVDREKDLSPQESDVENNSSHTIMLDDQDNAAMLFAQRFLDDSPESDGIVPADDLAADEQPDESIDAVVLSDDQDSESIDSTGDQYFTEADSAPPVNAADILKKYAGDNLYDGLDDEVEPESTASPRTSIDEGNSDADGDDDSIRDYMDQLMRRVSGESTRMPSGTDYVAEAERPEPDPAPEPVAENPEKKDKSFEVMASGEYMPRSSAPEQTDNLAKMREVAMSSAHNAITTATRRRRTEAAVIHLAMAFAAGTAGAVLFSYQTAGISPVRCVTAFAAIGISAWWIYRAVSFAIGRHQLPTNTLLGKLLGAIRSKKSNDPSDELPTDNHTPSETAE